MPDRDRISNDAHVDLDSIADLSASSPVCNHLIAIARDLQQRVLERLREELNVEETLVAVERRVRQLLVET